MPSIRSTLDEIYKFERLFKMALAFCKALISKYLLKHHHHLYQS